MSIVNPGSPSGEELPAVEPGMFAELVADLALAYADERDRDRLSLTEQIIAGAISTIPGVVAAAVETLDRDGRLTAPVMVGDQRAREIMQAQNESGTGPCLDALRDAKQVVVTDLEQDLRWPPITAAAAPLGIKAVLCTPMQVGGRSVGVLSLLSSSIDFGDPGEDSSGLARVFAAHAALALAGSATAGQMATALGSRDLIGQAKGILMERFGLTPDVAFTVLVRTSSHTNTRLRAVCEHLCDTGRLPAVPDRTGRD